jgi:hypothetical protein
LKPAYGLSVVWGSLFYGPRLTRGSTYPILNLGKVREDIEISTGLSFHHAGFLYVTVEKWTKAAFEIH